jgi:DNA-binding NarL/FixJ family response regulator
VKVLLADDHKMVRAAIRAVLESSGVQVVGEAANGREAIAMAKHLRPAVVVLDLAMPELNGIDTTRQLRSDVPEIKVIALTMTADRGQVMAVLEAGATGYVLKSSAAEELLAALAAVERGQVYVSPAIKVAEEVVAREAAPADGALSRREREVLQLVAEGKSSKEIGMTLGIALATVETHRRQITAKLGLRTVAELTKYSIRMGMTSVDR